jgi:glycosyltransferase involved in cell wall biosynthesis
MQDPPFFSVIVPTYRRAQLLERALASVLAQRFSDFEVLVTDDDREGDEVEQAVQRIAAGDKRLRVVRNSGPAGQVGNTNNGLHAARGQWLKILHDDDILYPDCLETFYKCIRVAGRGRRISLACCQSDSILLSGTVRKWRGNNVGGDCELLESPFVALAMYLQESIGSSVPSCVCIHRELAKAHCCEMPAHQDLRSCVDTLWALQLGSIGDRLIINRALVGKYEEPSSVTAGLSDADLDHEFHLLRGLQFQVIPDACRPPPLYVAQQTLSLQRAMHRLIVRRQPLQALRLARRAWLPAAWVLLIRQALARRWPMLRTTRRERIAIPEMVVD